MTLKRYLLAWALCLACTVAGPAGAQAPEPAAPGARVSEVKADMTAGEVRKVDLDARKLTPPPWRSASRFAR